LIHDPSEHRSTGSIVRGCSPPNVVEHVERDLFCAGMVAENAHGQRENQTVAAVVQCPQSKLVAGSNGFDELAPFSFQNARLCPVGIEQLTESACRAAITVLMVRGAHGRKSCRCCCSLATK